jgi:hypothetical protein
MRLVKNYLKNYLLKGAKGKFCALAFVILMVSGCGYTLNHRLKDQFTNHKGFFIPVFDNTTNEAGAEIVFTNALIYEMKSHGEEVLSEKQSGGILVHGVVESVSYKTEALGAPGFQGLHQHVRIPDQISVTVQVRLRMTDMQTQKEIWSNGYTRNRWTAAPSNRTYDVDAPSSLGLFTQSLIEATYVDVARDMMRDVYDSMVDFF